MNTFVKRLVTVTVSLFLIAYVIYQGVQVYYTPVKTETVGKYSAYETVNVDGITIRNETLIKSNVKGYLYYTIENGSRVSKDGTIADVYASEQDSRIHQEINDLSEEITLLQTIQSQGSANRVNLDVIDQQIRQNITKLSTVVNSPGLSGMNSWRSELLALFNKRQMTIGKVGEFNDRIAALTAQKAQLATSYSPATSSVKSPVAGYFVSQADGYENALDFNDVTTMTTDKIQNAMNGQPATVASDVVGKVVGDYKWYLACVVEAKDAGSLKMESTPDILLPFVTTDTIPTKVVAANRDKSGNIAIVLECSYMSSRLSSIRCETVQIRLNKYSGLRVPSGCVLTNDDGVQGVYVQRGDTVVFRKIEILYATPDYVICRETDDNGYLELYDDVITQGKGLYDGKTIR